MITVTGRTAAWTALILALAGCAAFLAFWAFAGSVTPSEGVLGAVAATFAAAAVAWLFGKRSRGRHRS